MAAANRQNLTKKFIEAISAPDKGRVNYWDSKQPKLCLRVTSSGVKTFYFVTKFQGKTEWSKLDRYPAISVDQARTAAIMKAGEYAVGHSPVQQGREAKAEWTVADAWKRYKADLDSKGRSVSNVSGYWGPYFQRWEAKRLSEVTPLMAAIVQEEAKAKLAPASVNRVVAVGQAFFNFASRQILSAYDGPNPFAKLEKLPVKPRKTRLLPHQIGDFFKALDQVSDDMKDVFMLALYSGRRRGEILTMRWVDVDLDSGTWVVPNTKSGESQTTALPEAACNIIAAREKRSKWVFPSDRSATGHIRETKNAWKRVREIAGLPDLHLHDLRRSLSSFGQEQNIAVAVMQQTLGHKDPQTTLKHYTDIAVSVQRQALEEIATNIKKAAGK